MRLEFRDDVLKPRDQIQEYIDRVDALQCMNLFNFILNTYDVKKRTKKIDEDQQHNEDVDDIHTKQEIVPSSDSHFDYCPDSGCLSKTRFLQQGGHETLPDFISGWFPD